jgi:citrate lyase subunit beta / citryl-CoA lyase
MTRIARSYLFVPATRPERFAKAHASGADAVVVDLEDAVAPDDKAAAREALAAALDPARPVVVRINAAGTRWFDEDLELCAHPGVAAVMLPKAEGIDAACAVVERTLRDVLALVETAAGIETARAIARVPGVVRLAFGSLDLKADLGVEGDDDELLAFRSELVLASRLGGLAAPVDGVCTAIGDAQRLRAETVRARRLGFGAKLCIHPSQPTEVNAAFAPDAAELDWARRVVEGFRAARGGVFLLDGRMIDAPVHRRALTLLGRAGADAGAAGAPGEAHQTNPEPPEHR